MVPFALLCTSFFGGGGTALRQKYNKCNYLLSYACICYKINLYFVKFYLNSCKITKNHVDILHNKLNDKSV